MRNPDDAALAIAARLDQPLPLAAALHPRGAVIDVGDGVARVVGLEVGSEELVRFDSGALGMAYDLARGHTSVVALVGADRIQVGQGAARTHELPSLPVGEQLLGRIVDPLGRPLDGRPPLHGRGRVVLREAPKLIARGSVDRTLHTGVMAIDAAIPLGRGQRQLIIGDRNVGKTALALDIVAAQRPDDVGCVYVVIGQPLSRVLAIRDVLAEHGALANTAIVAAEAAEPPGLQYLAPYAGMCVAEQLREQGRDALVVFDDLTKHADAYRELALLLGRPPGREAFPGDIFYIHAELLERATAFAEQAGGRSVTALPIVETTDSDLAAYIPTNLISITDGQIYLDAGRFERNERPAIDVGRSVSRIGGAAQRPLMRTVAHNLRIDMSRAASLEGLTRMGLDIDPRTRDAIAKGRALRQLLRQDRFVRRSLAAQVLALAAVDHGWLGPLDDPHAAAQLCWSAIDRVREEAGALFDAIERGAAPDDWPQQAAPYFASKPEPAKPGAPSSKPGAPSSKPGASSS